MITVRDEDILPRDVNGYLDHEGNKRYRRITQEYARTFVVSKAKSEKRKLDKQIFDRITEGNGRFLRWKDGEYVEMEESKAIAKIRQSLRDKQKKLKFRN